MQVKPRHYQLLSEVVRCYVKAAEPVGSKALATRLGVSSATIRNDMAILEEQGYLWQPHTSAGRVPTVKGFQFYLDNLGKVPIPRVTEQKLLRDVLKHALEAEQCAKNLARLLSELAKEAALVAFAQEYTYYTGLAHLFKQPEFADINMVREIGYVVDNLDEGLRRLVEQTAQGVQVRIGPNNPLGEDCAVIFTNLRLYKQPILLGLLGPVRMDYETNIARLNYVSEFFANE
jgi:transcriptional regulator of heat shock response